MTIAWPAVNRDASEEVRSSLLNDGERLSLTLRGIEFHGASPDDRARWRGRAVAFHRWGSRAGSRTSFWICRTSCPRGRGSRPASTARGRIILRRGWGSSGASAASGATKDGYRKGGSKEDLLAIWKTLTRTVQETGLCPESEPRRPGTGYRG